MLSILLRLHHIHPFKGKSAKKASEQQLVPKKIDSISRGQWSAITGGLEFHRKDRIKSVDKFRSLIEPQAVVRKRRRVAVLLLLLAVVISTPFAMRYYEMAVEDRVMQTPITTPAAKRPVLTAQQKDEVNGLIRLAQMQMGSVSDQSSAENFAYVLSFGPNNVVQLVETVLQIDPGYEAALELRQRAFDAYIAKARQLEGDKAYEQALSLTRNADEVIPNTGIVRRLQRSICGSAPAVCGSQ